MGSLRSVSLGWLGLAWLAWAHAGETVDDSAGKEEPSSKFGTSLVDELLTGVRHDRACVPTF